MLHFKINGAECYRFPAHVSLPRSSLCGRLASFPAGSRNGVCSPALPCPHARPASPGDSGLRQSHRTLGDPPLWTLGDPGPLPGPLQSCEAAVRPWRQPNSDFKLYVSRNMRNILRSATNEDSGHGARTYGGDVQGPVHRPSAAGEFLRGAVCPTATPGDSGCSSLAFSARRAHSFCERSPRHRPRKPGTVRERRMQVRAAALSHRDK